MATGQCPSQLTLNGIKKIVESKSLATEFQGVDIALQIIDVTMFTAENAKKNIKCRVSLSDGVSKMVCMVPDKTYNNLVRKLPPLCLPKLHLGCSRARLHKVQRLATQRWQANDPGDPKKTVSCTPAKHIFTNK